MFLEVCVQDLAGLLCCVFFPNTLLSQCFSSPRSTNGNWWIVKLAWQNTGGEGEGRHNLQWTWFPSTGIVTLCYRNWDKLAARWCKCRPFKILLIWQILHFAFLMLQYLTMWYPFISMYAAFHTCFTHVPFPFLIKRFLSAKDSWFIWFHL